MRKHNRGPRLPDFTRSAQSVTGPDGGTCLVLEQDAAFIPVSQVEMVASAETKVLPRDPFKAEEVTFRPSNETPAITRLNEYLNEFGRANPGAALLQMIPTASSTYLFVWEL